MTATINKLAYVLTAALAAVGNLYASTVKAARADTRVRWSLGAGASVLLSVVVLGMGGSVVPGFLHASESAQAQAQLTPVPQTPIVFPVEERQEGLAVADMSTSTVLEVIQNMRKGERYELMLYNSGVDEILKSSSNVTVFVPASAEFDYLPKHYIASLTRTELKTLALGHIVERALPLQESLGGTVYTAANTTLNFTVDASAGEATIGGAKILKAYKAQNGMVYLIDKVLVPGN